MSTFGEVLEEFKNKEEPENIVALVDDRELQVCMLAWKSVRINYKLADDCNAQDPVDRWEWLWSRIEYDTGRYGTVAGLKAQDTGRMIERLRGMRLIYPDGTINHLGSQYLQSIIFEKLGKSMKKQAPKTQAAGGGGQT